jgi:dTDP-4-dehydrorhamnose reductase
MTWPASRELPWETAGQEPDDRPRILLIGASGQIGRELWRALQPLGCVLCTRHSSAGAITEPAELELDLSLPTTIPAVMDHVRPNLVVNAAGYTNVERAEEEPDLAMIVNAIAVGVLAEEAGRLGAALVHYSTDYVFDGSDNVPWHESDISHPLNVYGRSKLAGEDAIRSSGAPHLIVRTSWVYSPTGRNFVLTMLGSASQPSMIRVVDDQIGAPTPAWLVADTTAQVLAQARGEFAQFLSRRGGTLHVTCRGATTWHGLAVELFCQARRRGAALLVQEVEPISSAEYGSPVQRPANSRLDCRRLRQRFGLVPPDWRTALGLSLEEMLRRRNEVVTNAPTDGVPENLEESR